PGGRPAAAGAGDAGVSGYRAGGGSPARPGAQRGLDDAAGRGGSAMSRMIVLALCGMLCGCGYRMAGSRGLYTDQVNPVAVPPVANETLSPSDTAQLTSALVRQLEARTPCRVASVEEA